MPSRKEHHDCCDRARRAEVRPDYAAPPDAADRVLITYVLDGDSYRETGRFTDEVAIDEPVMLRFALTQLPD